jgi:misacylated tRNA(Ala) deacylase
MDALFRADAYLRSCEAAVIAADAAGVRLDRTVFYPVGGGQPGDTGVLRAADGRIFRIADTVKGDQGPDDCVHVIAAEDALPEIGLTLTAEIDWDRRFRHMRMHTALHLLCAVVPGAITGAQVGADKSRVDFNVPGDSLDKAALTAAVNELVARDLSVSLRWIADAELEAQPELIRTMSVKPPMGLGQVRLVDIAGVDLQPCGGTHVARTGDIGRLDVVKIENKGKQNRRIVVALSD